MVQIMNSGGMDQKKVAMKPTVAISKAESTKRSPVKLEIEEPSEVERGPPSKRSKLPLPFQQWCTQTSMVPPQPAVYNPLDEPSPLGLRLRKSPSLLDLIQMRLSQGDAATLGVDDSGDLVSMSKDSKGALASGTADKLKASNFPASLLRIGSWECVSRYEGDLVAKCYFAKHKLVWEVLEGRLKSKIEIQWSDITALKATFPDNEPGTLDIVLARQPLFFRETNPQPRKHTLWQATSDFTGGQATIHRRHFLQVPHGLLNKHFEKLIQCDPRLNLLSQRGDITLDSPFFDPRSSAFEDQDNTKFHGFDHLKKEYVSAFSGFPDSGATCTAQSSGFKSEPVDHVGRVPESVSRETPSPSSVMDSRAIEEYLSNENEESKGSNLWEQFNVPALRSSMSMSDLVNHIEHCIAEQRTSGNPATSGEGPWNKGILDEITQHLLGDSHNSLASDEQCLMARVNSLYCLLEKDATTDQAIQANCEKNDDAEASTDEQSDEDDLDTVSPLGGCSKMSGHELDNSSSKQNSAMSRKDSLGDLLLSLPRIASLPQFFSNSSDDGNRAR